MSEPIRLQILEPAWFPDREAAQEFLDSPRCKALVEVVSDWLMAGEDVKIPMAIQTDAANAADSVVRDLYALARGLVADGPLHAEEDPDLAGSETDRHLIALTAVTLAGRSAGEAEAMNGLIWELTNRRRYGTPYPPPLVGGDDGASA